MDRGRRTVTKYLNDEKTHAVINTKLFKRLDHTNAQLYEVELAKAEIEHREPIIVGFFILQYAKLRMLELYYNFFERFCDEQIWGVRNGHWLFVFGCLKKSCTIAFEKNLKLHGN